MEVRGAADILGTLNGQSGRQVKARSISTTQTLLSTDDCLFIAPSGNVTITLPPALLGLRLYLKKTTTGTGSLTIVGQSSAKIDTANSYSINSNTRGYVILISDGTNWWRLS